MDNKTLLAKAQIKLSDLVTDGGYLRPKHAASFILSLIDSAELMKMCYVTGMASPKMYVDKIVFGDRILHGVSGDGTALAEAQRSKPTTDNIELDSQMFKAEIRIPQDVIEDNIQGDGLKTTVMGMIKERVALDMDEIIANGDTTSSDPDLAMLDGIRKQASSNVVDVGGASTTKAVLHNIIKTMPKKYRRNRRDVVFLMADQCELAYRNSLAERATGGGDKWLAEDIPVFYSGSPIRTVPVLPENLGVGSNYADMLYLNPKNIRVGIYKKVQLRTDEDISAGVLVIVARVRFDVKYTEEQAVTKAHSIAV